LNPQRLHLSNRAALFKHTGATSDEEVIAHLESLAGADVRVALEIDARIPNGAPEDVVRIVTENC